MVYFPQTLKKKLLTPKQEIELGRRIYEARKRGEIDIEARNEFVNRNYRLILGCYKRMNCSEYNSYDEFIVAGEDALIRAAELFDYTRGFRFSTYATWAIWRRFQRVIKEITRQKSRKKNLEDNALDYLATSCDSDRIEMKDLRKKINAEMKKRLSPREREIIRMRYLYYDRKTLEEAGQMFGVTKERIRQIEFRALRKLEEGLKDDAQALLS